MFFTSSISFNEHNFLAHMPSLQTVLFRCSHYYEIFNNGHFLKSVFRSEKSFLVLVLNDLSTLAQLVVVKGRNRGGLSNYGF